MNIYDCIYYKTYKILLHFELNNKNFGVDVSNTLYIRAGFKYGLINNKIPEEIDLFFVFFINLGKRINKTTLTLDGSGVFTNNLFINLQFSISHNRIQYFYIYVSKKLNWEYV